MPSTVVAPENNVAKEIEPSTPIVPEVKELPVAATTNTIENTNIKVLPTVTEKTEKIVEKPIEQKPIVVETPAPEPQIIEKTVPVINTVETIEKVVQTAPPVSQPLIEPEIKLPTVNETPATLPTTPVAPVPAVTVNSEPPVVNVNVTESPLPQTPPPVNISTPPVISEPKASEQPTVVETPVPSEPVVIEKPIEKETPLPEFSVKTEPAPAPELPSMLTESEVKRPEPSLDLADESLLKINNSIDRLIAVFGQGQDKLSASINSLNTSVGEILKILPTLQQSGNAGQSTPSRKSRDERIDSSSIISNYRQNLNLTTRGYTQNTVFPGNNSIS